MKFVKVTSIKPAGLQPVYDLSMAPREDPSFIANGFIVHNSYASAESAYSSFLETCSGYRSHLTNAIFYRKLFPLIAVSNGMYKDKTKRKNTDSIVDFLFNTANRFNLKQPTLHWHKELTGTREDNLMEMLEKVSEKGVNIPIKMWLAAAGIDKDTLVRDAKQEAELKKDLGIALGTPQAEAEPDVEDEDSGDREESNDSERNTHEIASPPAPPVTSASFKWKTGAGGFRRKPILSRKWEGEAFDIGKTGQKKHVFNASAKVKDQNWRIAKIAASFANDPSHREDLRQKNIRATGRDSLAI